MLEVGTKLNALIQDRGMTKRQVADRTGLHYSLMFKWAMGTRSPSLGTLKRVVEDVLGMELEIWATHKDTGRVHKLMG